MKAVALVFAAEDRVEVDHRAACSGEVSKRVVVIRVSQVGSLD